LVKKIKSNGYKIGMITDNKTDRIKLIADSHKLNELFNVICVSASLGVSKSGKEIFLEALHRAEVSPTEAVFIDNNPENLISPTELGIHTLHFDHDKRDYDKLIKQLICFGVKI
jgi:putative hydrolase of the HAD superfamily